MNSHLDDEQLCALLDEGPDDDAHLRACPDCRGRLHALSLARDAVAAPVVPLAPAVLDQLVASAVAAGGVSMATTDATVDLAARRRRLRPPAPWLVSAAAALVALVGVAGLLRATGPERSGDAGLAARVQADRSAADEGAVAAESAMTAPVFADLGDLDDPAALVALLVGAPGGGGDADDFAAARPTSGGRSGAAGTGGVTATTSGAGPTAGGAAKAAPLAAPPAPRCRADAERIGAGKLGAHLSTSTARWKGQPAEVLVFLLTEPANGVTRQALVLALPGCALLADPHF